MVAIIRTEWDGTSGGPGLTQFALMGGSELSSGTAQGAVNAVHTFWNTVRPYIPDEVKLQVVPTMDVYNDQNAELTASYVAPSLPALITGGGTTGYAGGAGIKINWNTGTIRNGRRVKGATFIVPVLASCFGITGTVAGAVMTTVSGAASTLMSQLASAGAPLVVWSRPLVEDKAIIRNGAVAGVINGACGSKSALLRGRRD